MSGIRNWPLRLTWDPQQGEVGASELTVCFLPGRSRVRTVRRAATREETAELAPRPSGDQGWIIPLTADEHRAGELQLLVGHDLAVPIVAALDLRARGGAPLAPVADGQDLVQARGQVPQALPESLREAFAWFTAFELRSNHDLISAGGGTLNGHPREEVLGWIEVCRANLLAQLRVRAESALSRALLPRLLRSADFARLSAEHLGARDRAPGSWRRSLRGLGQAARTGLRPRPPARRATREALRRIRDAVLDGPNGAWSRHSPREIGRHFRLFAKGSMRLHDHLHELSAEPDSCYFFLFAELAIALSELPVHGEATEEPTQEAAERVRWRELAREFVISEHLFRRAYAPGLSLRVSDFDAYTRVNLDRDPRRRTSTAELARLESLYEGLDVALEEDWQRLLDDHALLVSLTCPGWLEPWHDLSHRLDHALEGATVPADGFRAADHAARLFVRHTVSAFADLPHEALEGDLPLAALGLAGDQLDPLALSLRGYVAHCSGGQHSLRAEQLDGLTVGELLRLVVGLCRRPTAGDPPDGRGSTEADRSTEAEEPPGGDGGASELGGGP